MSEEVYKMAGVDRDAAGSAKDRIFKLARSTFTPGVLGDIGIASLMGRYDTVGEDIVNHTTNDILTCGAKPLFFLDYMGMGTLSTDKVESLMFGMAKACKALDCALIGGETAEMPDMYAHGDVELVGFVVGAVERDAVIDGSGIAAGDVLLGLPSNGLHTNGYSLVRKLFGIDDDPSVLGNYTAELGVTLGDALLVPHMSYVAQLTPTLDRIKGMAHITGGGFTDNVPRMLPEGLAARLDSSAWEVPPLFQLIQQRGKISDDEMNRVFNMGIGMIVAVAPGDVASVCGDIPEAIVVGEVAPAGEGPQVSIS